MRSIMNTDERKNRQDGEKMKRVIILFSLACICLATARPTSGQMGAKSAGKKSCLFSIAGLWRSEVTAQTNSIFFDFSPEGYVTLMGHSAGLLPQDFEMLESVNYKLDPPTAPKTIEFTAAHGNDAFEPG